MLAACAYHLIGATHSRFARSLGALIAALQEFRDLGVDFISHTQAIDATTPMGRLFFGRSGST